MTEDVVHENTWLLHMTMWMYVPLPEIEELMMIREECSTTELMRVADILDPRHGV
jgi:hypothetical protein